MEMVDGKSFFLLVALGTLYIVHRYSSKILCSTHVDSKAINNIYSDNSQHFVYLNFNNSLAVASLPQSPEGRHLHVSRNEVLLWCIYSPCQSWYPCNAFQTLAW